jgi:hypothetical protein
MQGTDYTIKNEKGYKPGENTLDARMYQLFINVDFLAAHSFLKKKLLLS